ncbi:MAG: sugar phosphate isomerase/epimerase [Planctomycetes bacterium]|nr:sugar phosphate isomerase/epimerase [Planctomycetota bacterium]
MRILILSGWRRSGRVVRGAGVRISCIGGFYGNNLDPSQSDESEQIIRGTIRIAQALGVDRVAGFVGRWPVDGPLEDSMPAYEAFWKPMAAVARDAGIRIAFEHCPMGLHHLPPGGINAVCTPAMWDRMFAPAWADGLGIEWDASHLICQRIDPVLNIHHYGDRIVHVHAKDAMVYRHIMDRYGIYHPGAIEHCFPGLGDADWPAIVKALYRAGYDSDLNIEGWHDAVYCNREGDLRLEDTGLLVAHKTLAPLVDGK